MLYLILSNLIAKLIRLDVFELFVTGFKFFKIKCVVMCLMENLGLERNVSLTVEINYQVALLIH